MFIQTEQTPNPATLVAIPQSAADPADCYAEGL